ATEGDTRCEGDAGASPAIRPRVVGHVCLLAPIKATWQGHSMVLSGRSPLTSLDAAGDGASATGPEGGGCEMTTPETSGMKPLCCMISASGEDGTALRQRDRTGTEGR